MRESPVYRALHRQQLVGGMNKSYAGLIWSLSFAAAMLCFVSGLEIYAPLPVCIGGLVYRWNKWRYSREPALDRIIKAYERQADVYDPWPQSMKLRGYERPEGFLRDVRS